MTRFWVAMLTVAIGATVFVAVPPATAAPDNLDTVGFVDPETGLWWFVEDQVSGWSFYYGNPGDYPFMGDWNCDGVDTPGLYRQSDGYVYLRNSNTQGIADISFYFGNPGDVPIAGDFNADGCDTVSIYRPSEQRFYIINQLGTSDGGLGAAEYSFIFGNPGDKPFVGDFNGNGQDTIGLHRESTGLVYFRNTNTTGIADNQFYFGDPGDRFMAGDWTGDGTDTPGLFRPSDLMVYLRHTNTQGNADEAWPARVVVNWLLPVAGRLTNYDCDAQTSIPATECDALVTLYQETGGIGWKDHSNWLTHPDPCTWHGVSCNGGSVRRLELFDNYLTGTIPPELGSLANLTHLSLTGGNSGSPWPPLTGQIPTELGNLSNLRSLDLEENELSGSIPAELASLSNLESLSLNDNQLSGTIPPGLGNLTQLRHLDILSNKVWGPIPPELGNLTSLQWLSLGFNQLYGQIPAQLGNLTLLNVLLLPSNRLSGPVPTSLTNLTTLGDLWLFGQAGCLTAATPTFASWISSFDPLWNDGCLTP